MSRSILPIAIIVAALVFANNAPAQDKSKMSDQHAAILNQTLREVIDAGAKIFNENGDHAGCYRMWQGSLMSIKPFLPPDMQSSIVKGLASAEKLNNFADKAFELRKVMDEIRIKTRGGSIGKADGKDGQVLGKVVYAGKPLAGGTITLVAGGKNFSGTIAADGTFSIQKVPVGDYKVAIASKAKEVALPARYNSADTSGLSVRVQAGTQTVSLELVK
jgi:hypothetical protein